MNRVVPNYIPSRGHAAVRIDADDVRVPAVRVGVNGGEIVHLRILLSLAVRRLDSDLRHLLVRIGSTTASDHGETQHRNSDLVFQPFARNIHVWPGSVPAGRVTGLLAQPAWRHAAVLADKLVEVL